MTKIMKERVELENRPYFSQKVAISTAQLRVRTRLKENLSSLTANKAHQSHETKYHLAKTWTNLLTLRSISAIIQTWIKLSAWPIKIISKHRSLRGWKNLEKVIKVKWLRRRKIITKRTVTRDETARQASTGLATGLPMQRVERDQ